MGLRDEWESEDNEANKDCHVWKWLQSSFDEEDRAFLLGKMSNPDVKTVPLLLWLKRKDKPAVGEGTMNHHRGRRCTCPHERGGRIV